MKPLRLETKRDESSLAKTLAPEEIRRGDFVTPLYVVSEWPSWYWDDDDALHPRDELVRIRSTPCDEAAPLEVIGVCLPFVLVETPQRDGKTLDVRRVRLARLDRIVREEDAPSVAPARKAASVRK